MIFNKKIKKQQKKRKQLNDLTIIRTIDYCIFGAVCYNEDENCFDEVTNDEKKL